MHKSWHKAATKMRNRNRNRKQPWKCQVWGKKLDRK